MKSVVAGRSLSQGYGRRAVLDGLEIDVPEGVTVLLGPNGAGKTTLLETLTLQRKAWGGSLSVCGVDTTRPAGRRLARRSIGYLPQYFGYFPRFTVIEFVEYAAWLKGVPGQRLRLRALAAIEKVDLSSRANHQLRKLSGGMLRRVGIAQAIVHKPALIVLDEPTAGLDPQQRIQFRAFVRDLPRGTSALISTHLVEDVNHLGAHVLVLADGAIEFAGSPAELTAEATGQVEGDTPLERGYASVLARRSRG